MGNFQVWREGSAISSKEWGRDKTIQLFQYLLTARHRRALHKEQIADRLWEELDNVNQTFKVALHGVNKVLEPNRKSRTEPRYVQRQGITYQLDLKDMWVDVAAVEELIRIGNDALTTHQSEAIIAYQKALDLYQGIYLPNRLYEDWSSAERERIQLFILNTYISLGELLLSTNPVESIRLAQQALLLDATWEEAYRLQMDAYLKKGNRPMAIKTYRQCEEVLQKEFGIAPLPETKALIKNIIDLA